MIRRFGAATRGGARLRERVGQALQARIEHLGGPTDAFDPEAMDTVILSLGVGLAQERLIAREAVPDSLLGDAIVLLYKGGDCRVRGRGLGSSESVIRRRGDAMGLSDYRVEAAAAVSDLERARRFYGEQLGLEVREEDEQGTRYRCADGTGIFIYLSPENAGQSRATLAGWFVDDLDRTMDELAGRGVAFQHYDQPALKTDEGGILEAGRFRAAWVEDPDGNTLALTELSA